MTALTRDGGEPRPSPYQRPMTAAETLDFMAKLAHRLDRAADAQASHDGNGAVTVRLLWADDEEGGVVTFSPVTAEVQS